MDNSLPISGTHANRIPPTRTRTLDIKTAEGKHLFSYDPEKDAVHIKQRGKEYEVPFHQIVEFLRSARGSVMKVFELDEDRLPCGHEAGTYKNVYEIEVCSVCHLVIH